MFKSGRVIYQRTLQQITDWIAQRPGNSGAFESVYFTTTALSVYLEERGAKGYSLSHRARVKAIASRFARWRVEDKGLLSRNPVRQVFLPPQQQLTPRQLSSDQRYILRNLAEFVILPNATGLRVVQPCLRLDSGRVAASAMSPILP